MVHTKCGQHWHRSNTYAFLQLSVATTVGFIALAGVSAEFGVIMLPYLKQAWQPRIEVGTTTQQDLLDAIQEGAVLRIGPKMMTVTVIVASLLPIFLGGDTGSELMSQIAAPMVGGILTAPLLSLFVLLVALIISMCSSALLNASFGRIPIFLLKNSIA